MHFSLLSIGLAVSAASLAFAAPLVPRGDDDTTIGYYPIVTLPYGRYRGAVSTDRKTVSFLGIPFAKPPLGSLRFRQSVKPDPVGTPSSTTDATKPGNGCIQDPQSQNFGGVGLKTSEDCLNLNVFTPASSTSASNLPVIVYIYGGGFNDGYNNIPHFNGTNFLAAAESQQVVIVVPNYRTNVFGFLASAEIADEGGLNAGLLDQKLAFEWVRDNIALFGGNRNSVTAWGQSAGAISIASHMIAKNGTVALFDRAILHSGAIYPIYKSAATGQSDFATLAAAVNCTTSAILPCLRSVPATTLYTVSAQRGFNFNPIVDRSYIFNQPQITLANNKVRRIPTIFVGNTDEGTFFASLFGITNRASAEAFANANYFFLPSPVGALVQNYDFNADPVKAIADSFGDVAFTCPQFQLADALVRAGVTVYKARFNHLPALLKIMDPVTSAKLRVYHSAELAYAWNSAYPTALLPQESTLVRGFVNAYVDFAAGKTPGRSIAAPWPVYDTQRRQLVISAPFNATVTEVKDTSTDYHCDIWFASTGGLVAYLDAQY
ncbi:Carboxylesterase [Entophlyctis helioformis]|nr:Carboxylesterase [Entophlyctis helioformis]